jgi:Flp pilus assembly pilin Flp
LRRSSRHGALSWPPVVSRLGQTLTEYAFMIAVIAIVVLLAANAFGGMLQQWFWKLVDYVVSMS